MDNAQGTHRCPFGFAVAKNLNPFFSRNYNLQLIPKLAFRSCFAETNVAVKPFSLYLFFERPFAERRRDDLSVLFVTII